MEKDSLNIYGITEKPNNSNVLSVETLLETSDASSAEDSSGKMIPAEELLPKQEPSPALDRYTSSQSSYNPVQDGLVREPDPAYTYGTGARKDSDRIAREPDPACTYGAGARKNPDGIVCEPGPTYNYGTGARKKSGGEAPGRLLTLEDYLALPDDRRVELIDGVIYDMAAPSRIHQRIALLVWMELENCIRKKGLPCEAIAAPYDVNLDKYTVVQPDVMVFCGDDPGSRNLRATHAPDLVIEVLSPSTASRDRFLKLKKYRERGVKEFWLVSPKSLQVEVYLFSEGEDTPRRYSFSDKVPVHISEEHPEGRCEVDFEAVTRGLNLK